MMLSMVVSEPKCQAKTGVIDSSAYHLASAPHWSRCRLKDATKVNDVARCAVPIVSRESLVAPRGRQMFHYRHDHPGRQIDRAAIDAFHSTTADMGHHFHHAGG